MFNENLQRSWNAAGVTLDGFFFFSTKKGRERGRKEAFRLNETPETGQLTADSPPKVDLVLEEKGHY